MKELKVYCQNCKKQAIKFGNRKNKNQVIQRYKCNFCNKTFTLQHIKYKTYPIRTILKAISLYNLGYKLNQVSNLLISINKIQIPISTISSWINEYKEICTFSKLRDNAIKLYNPNDIIFKKPLQHQQVYLFQYHKAKLYLLFHDIKYNNQFKSNTKLYANK